MRIPLALVTVLVICTTSSALAEEQIGIPNAFVTGQKYREMQEPIRAQYIMGLVDGLHASVIFGASQSKVRELQQCLLGRTNVQIAAIMSKYVEEHPEDWHIGMHILFYRRAVSLCPRLIPD